MLSSKEIVCPEKLLKLAKTKGPVKVVIVNAGKAVSIESSKQAFDEGLIEPVFIGPFFLAISKRFVGQIIFLFDSIKFFHLFKYFGWYRYIFI